MFYVKNLKSTIKTLVMSTTRTLAHFCSEHCRVTLSVLYGVVSVRMVKCVRHLCRPFCSIKFMDVCLSVCLLTLALENSADFLRVWCLCVQKRVAGCCECGNESSCFVICGGFLE